MRKKPLLASIAFTAALVGGAIAGFLLGVPGVSQAQTTVPTTPPTTAAPAPGDTAPAAPGGGTHDPKNCPNMGGEAGRGRPDRGPDSSSGTNTGYRSDGSGYM